MKRMIVAFIAILALVLMGAPRLRAQDAGDANSPEATMPEAQTGEVDERNFEAAESGDTQQDDSDQQQASPDDQSNDSEQANQSDDSDNQDNSNNDDSSDTQTNQSGDSSDAN